jgi:hypothetical protein
VYSFLGFIMSDLELITSHFIQLHNTNRHEIHVSVRNENNIIARLLFCPNEEKDLLILKEAFGRGKTKSINDDKSFPEDTLLQLKITRLTIEEIVAILKAGITIIPD